ncbi:hypothetical protein LR48_Vigan02g178800 [Vigna angularis]|uniref:Uncharacterized protein n=1 Tax=Phaseolus angularis TaxID=3914 RepID=A0A0L9TYH1_PHAAN|nr:hypothetical protein LR48_Vigan02g178800 [Vigna angularis]
MDLFFKGKKDKLGQTLFFFSPSIGSAKGKSLPNEELTRGHDAIRYQDRRRRRRSPPGLLPAPRFTSGKALLHQRPQPSQPLEISSQATVARPRSVKLGQPPAMTVTIGGRFTSVNATFSFFALLRQPNFTVLLTVPVF